MMRARPTHFLILLGTALGWCAVAPPTAIAAGAPSRPIQFGAPEGSGVATNLNRLATKEDSLNPYTQTPLEVTPKVRGGSMDGVMAPLRTPQARSAAQTKRAKDLLERRKNWALMNNEDFASNPDEQETITKLRGSSKDPDKEEPLKLTPEEKFFLNLQESSAFGRKDLKKQKDDKASEKDAAKEDLPDSMSERDDALRRFMMTDINRSGAESDSSIFGGASRYQSALKGFTFLGQGSLPEQTPAQRARMDEFRQILGAPVAANPAKELFKPTPTPTFNSVLGDLPTPAASALNPVSGPVLSTATETHFGLVPALPNTAFGGQPLSIPSLTAPTLLPTEPPRAAPPTPNFLAPKRTF